jgi:methionyl-tRNA synthetase
VISPQQLIDLFGVDGSRYLIARSFPGENDGDVGMERFKEKYNADLANNLGNLVSRVCKLGEGLRITNYELRIDDIYSKLIDELKLGEAIGRVFEKFVDKSNNRLNEVEPWKLPADDPKRVEVLTECVNNLRHAVFFLKPIMPETCGLVEKVLSEEIKPLEKPLFPRI